MTIRQICRTDLISLDAGATVFEAARLMRDHHVGTVVVTQATADGLAVLGLLTDRDLVVQGLARGPLAHDQAVGPLVSGPPHAVPADADLAEALSRMEEHGVRRLLVTDDHGHLHGIVALDDLLPGLAQPFALLADVLRAGQAREAASRPLPAPPAPARVHVPAVGTAGWAMR